MNAMLIGARGRYVLVDAGVGFAPEALIGAERILPDLALLKSLAHHVEAVLITHGHEDHIGALPWVLAQLDKACPVYSSAFTGMLIKHRLEEHGAYEPERMHVLKARQRVQVGPFELEPIRVTHSIPDCFAFVLRSEDGTILHTGDWRIEEHPLDGQHFDREGFESVGREGVTLLLSDSTNILTPGRTRSERDVLTSIEQRIAGNDQRVVMTLFASNVHRLAGIADIARTHGRKIAFCGRSIEKYVEAAELTGQRAPSRDVIVTLEEALRLPPEQALIVCTGSQGEPRAALSRASENDHPQLKLQRGDTVMFSARTIPGNELEVYGMWNRFAAMGVKVDASRDIHTSGHAQTEELREMMQMVRPRYFVPVHGETSFLYAHAALGLSEGIETRVIRDGEALELSKERPLQVSGHTELVPHYNDGPSTGDADFMRLKERKRLGWNGLIMVDMALSEAQGRWKVNEVRVDARAVVLGEEDKLLSELKAVAERVIGHLPEGVPLREVQEAVRASVRAHARRATEKRPEVVVVLHKGHWV